MNGPQMNTAITSTHLRMRVLCAHYMYNVIIEYTEIFASTCHWYIFSVNYFTQWKVHYLLWGNCTIGEIKMGQIFLAIQSTSHPSVNFLKAKTSACTAHRILCTSHITYWPFLWLYLLKMFLNSYSSAKTWLVLRIETLYRSSLPPVGKGALWSRLSSPPTHSLEAGGTHELDT